MLWTKSYHDANFLSSLIAQEVVVMTTYSATSGSKVGMVMTQSTVYLMQEVHSK